MVIDDFFEDSLCRRLLEEFPSFEERYALNEFGDVGGKAVRMDVRDISPAYRALDAYIQTPEFLGLVSRITGIPELRYDSDYVGGGTHENVNGQSLDPHIDFNYHPGTRWHRRLNLIVYLNPEWEASWGGALELHSDPWNESVNEVRAVAPLFNRCVIFETSERSWHGFRRIDLPPERGGISRKSFAIYLYTEHRPAEETAPPHATIYVPDAMPAHLGEGSTLCSTDVEELRGRFTHLRQQLKFLYDRELDFGRQIRALEGALAEARSAQGFPLQGYAVPAGALSGFWPDGWAGRSLRFGFEAREPVAEIEFEFWVPPALAGEQVLTIELGGSRHEVRIAPGARQRVEFPIALSRGGSIEITITSSHVWRPKDSGESNDERPLAWRLIEARLRHR
ncbi:MAG TPA: 2OG-Fe(II) oxygenase [Xanthomonadaceae bacterium]|nr:2OG-Fe(II) oxygenase [Xanthomonadaceae bacterium]